MNCGKLLAKLEGRLFQYDSNSAWLSNESCSFFRKYQCLYPCTLIHTRETFSRDYDAKKDQGLATISFHFEENIKVMKSSYLVSFYTLVSNIGGCIGIFLGWSIMQLKDIIDSRFYKN